MGFFIGICLFETLSSLIFVESTGCCSFGDFVLMLPKTLRGKKIDFWVGFWFLLFALFLAFSVNFLDLV